VPGGDEFRHDCGADVAGGACDEYAHGGSFMRADVTL
jgi:hypothetical protein